MIYREHGYLSYYLAFFIASISFTDLLNNLFKHPYTKIAFIEADLNVSRVTAANYLNRLAKDGLLKKERLGTGNYYVNEKLFSLLTK